LYWNGCVAAAVTAVSKVCYTTSVERVRYDVCH